MSSNRRSQSLSRSAERRDPNILPVYFTTQRGRFNASRDGPYYEMDEIGDTRSILSRTISEVSMMYLPNYRQSMDLYNTTKPLDIKVGDIKEPVVVKIEEDIVPPPTTTVVKTPPKVVKREPDYFEKFLIWFELYRKLFAIVIGFNLLALIFVTKQDFGYAKKNVFNFALGNLLVSVLCRNEAALRILYWLTVKLFPMAPIRVRNWVTAMFVHLGGIHSGCATAGLIWAIYAAKEAFKANIYPHAVKAFAVLTPIALGISIVVAMPYVRHNHHNVFERFHRFVGWLGLLYLWVLVVLLQSWDPARSSYHPGSVDWARKQELWFTVILSTMIVAPWLTLQRIPITVSVPSKKIAFLTFPGGCYTGLLGRLSRSLWLEWHAFGIISEGPLAYTHHMLVVAQGDWTRRLISDPPKFVWTRGLKFAGLPYLAEMYDRGVIVATGAGIGVTLSVCMQTKGYFHLLWIGGNIEETYGAELMALIRKAIPEDRFTLFDTKKQGRPDTVQLIDDIYRKIDAQVVFITSNPKGTEEFVNGCNNRGMTAFGPLFDS